MSMTWEGVFAACDSAEVILEEKEDGKVLPQEVPELLEEISNLFADLSTAEAWLEYSLDYRVTVKSTIERYRSNLTHVKGLLARLSRLHRKLTPEPLTGDKWCGIPG